MQTNNALLPVLLLGVNQKPEAGEVQWDPVKVLELSRAWQFTGEIWYLSLKREDTETGMRRSTLQDATESNVSMGMRFDPMRVTGLEVEMLWRWGQPGQTGSTLCFLSLQPLPLFWLAGWENHGPWRGTNSSEVIAGLSVCCQLSTNLLFWLDFNPSRAGTTSDSSCVPHQPSFLSAGNCSMSVSWGGNPWTGQPERRCWRKISEGQEGGEKGTEWEPLDSFYRKEWTSHCHGWNPFKGAGWRAEDSRESRSGSEWEGKGLRERQGACMVQGQNQGSTSVLGFQKAVPDLADPLPKTSSNPGYLVSEHHWSFTQDK